MKLAQFIILLASSSLLLSCIGIPQEIMQSCDTKTNNNTTTIIVFKPTEKDISILTKKGLHKQDSCKCDLDLQLWGTGSAQEIMGSDGLAKGGSGTPKGEGGEPDYGQGIPGLLRIGAKLSPNYYIHTPDTSSLGKGKTYRNLVPRLKPSTDKQGIIGIMDSGVYSDNLWVNPKETSLDEIDNDQNGLIDDLNGWNFTTSTSNINNQIENYHGTRVNYLIERSLGANYTILPMVVLADSNRGTLFNVLCAMAYSLKLKEKGEPILALNASLGYYGYSNSILTYYIDKLKINNIFLFTAAGNKADSSDCNFTDNRNLDLRTMKFWPASYSKTKSNVIAVTTASFKVKNGSDESCSVCSNDQNFSTTYVDLAVEGDIACNFRIPPIFEQERDSLLVYGTSFATPISTAYGFNQILNNNWREGRKVFTIASSAVMRFKHYYLKAYGDTQPELKVNEGKILRTK